MKLNLYPKSPALNDYEFIKPSSEFRNSVSSVIFSIFIFFIFYLLLIGLAAVVMVAAIWAGISLIAARPGFLTLAAGGGIIVLGIMVFVFLFKFIFSRTKDENPFRVEIKETDHPELFAFIRKLNEDTQTKFPKKIFLSPEVNAMVFYNSSFWSLFFPVRKNLEIGLGLINSLTVSEFKAVLAHEFGHFSQRSMKVGSYIYTVNRVIYNLVYEYDSWDNALSSWAQTGGIFGFFAGITFWLVQGVRGLLKIAYNLINVNYMKLSREMEYHADLVAISVSGNQSFKNALRKIEFTAYSYEYTTAYLQSLITKEKASNDLYQNHAFTTSYLARQNDLSFENGFPTITDEDLGKNVVTSRVNVKDQWASHPTLKEREANISKVNIESETNNDAAWTLFNNPEKIRRDTTKNLYKVGFPKVDFKPLEVNEFQEFVQEEINKYKLAEEYNGFYEGRYLSSFELKELINSETTKQFEEIYGKEKIEKIKRLEANKEDLQILGQISLKQIPTKYFEFDNKQYKRKEASELIKQLKQEIEAEEQFVLELDKQSFIHHYQNAKKVNQEKELVAHYQAYAACTETSKSIQDLNIQFQNLANALYSRPRWTEEELNQLINEFSSFENGFRDYLKSQSLVDLKEQIDSTEQKQALQVYLDNNTNYITSGLHEESFINLSNIIEDVTEAASLLYGNALKKMTDFQLALR